MAPGTAENLIDYLEARIVSGEYAPGRRIPSIRRLAARFGLGNGTVVRALDRLVERGLLEKAPRRGIFVRTAPLLRGGGDSRRIAVIMEPLVRGIAWHHGMYYTAYLGIVRAAENSGFTLVRCEAETVNATRTQLENLIAAVGPAGIIFLAEYDRRITALRLERPAAAIAFDSSFGGQLTTVNLNPYVAAREATVFFRERGVDRVRIMTDPRPLLMTRALIFRTVWQQAGGRCELLVNPLEDSRRRPRRYPDGCGYYFTSDHYTQTLCAEHFKRSGELLPERLTMLSVDGKRLIDPNFYRFPTLAINWLAAGRIVFEELRARMLDSSLPAKSILLEPKLYL